jgi:hypothetical protein
MMFFGITKPKVPSLSESERERKEQERKERLERDRLEREKEKELQQARFDAYRATLPNDSANARLWDHPHTMNDAERRAAIRASEWNKELDERAKLLGFDSHNQMMEIGNIDS